MSQKSLTSWQGETVRRGRALYEVIKIGEKEVRLSNVRTSLVLVMSKLQFINEYRRGRVKPTGHRV